jgi:hypothetical protein
MFAPNGKGFFRVAENDSDKLLAFLRIWDDPAKNPRPSNTYIVIAKKTGVAIEIDDEDFDFGQRPDQWMPPSVTSFGHCSLEQP